MSIQFLKYDDICAIYIQHSVCYNNHLLVGYWDFLWRMCEGKKFVAFLEIQT